MAQPNQALACWSIQVHFLQLLHGNSFQGIRRPFTKPVTCTAVDQGWIGTQAFPVVAPVAAEAAEFFALRPILCSALHMCILGLYRNHHTFSLHTYICWQSTRQASTGHEHTVASTEVLTYLNASPIGLMHSTTWRCRLHCATKYPHICTGLSNPCLAAAGWTASKICKATAPHSMNSHVSADSMHHHLQNMQQGLPLFACSDLQTKQRHACNICWRLTCILSSAGNMFGTSPAFRMLLMSSTNASSLIWLSLNRNMTCLASQPARRSSRFRSSRHSVRL